MGPGTFPATRGVSSFERVAEHCRLFPEFATALAVDPQSVRKRYSQTGSYHGVRPTKLPSRRLLWPAEAVKRLLNGNQIDD